MMLRILRWYGRYYIEYKDRLPWWRRYTDESFLSCRGAEAYIQKERDIRVGHDEVVMEMPL